MPVPHQPDWVNDQLDVESLNILVSTYVCTYVRGEQIGP